MRVPLLKATGDSVRYGFAVGKVRVLQSRIFGMPTYERLLDAETFEEQRRVLSDTVYGRYLEGVRTADGVERALERALDDFYRFVDEANLPDAVRRFFRVRYDWTNLKAKLKAEEAASKGASVKLDDMLEVLGSLPCEAFEGPGESLPEPFRAVYLRLRPLEDAMGTLGLDEAVDAAMFADLQRLAREARSDFLTQLAALMVDVANLRALARARMAGAAPAEAAGSISDGGLLRPQELQAAYPDLGELQRLVNRVPALSGLATEELADPARLDVVADDVVVRFVRRHRATSIGPEPVIAYVLAREAEVMMVRTLVVGKLAGVSSETLRSRLREMYV